VVAAPILGVVAQASETTDKILVDASEFEALKDNLRQLQQENQRLSDQLTVMMNRLFGKKSERIDPNQMKHLERQGFLSDDGTLASSEDEVQESLLPLFQAASIRGQTFQDSEPGATVEKVFQLVPSNQRFRPPTLCADFNGFSLHAATRIPAHDRATLERLCRYINRPPFSGQSLKLDSTGKIRFQLRHPWRDGTTHLRFDPLTFISRLAALVPPPKFHQLTYHGVLAPGDLWRDEVVPVIRATPPPASCASKPSSKPKRPRHRYLMAQLMP
jgi:hypothetical protein